MYKPGYLRNSVRVFRRGFAQSRILKSYEQQLDNATENVNKLLEVGDRLSYILAQYVPEPARLGFMAVRAFALEINKISDGGGTGGTKSQASSQLSSSMGISTSDIKFKFWSEQVGKVFQDRGDITEPTMVLLRDALRLGANLDVSYFYQYLQTRRDFLKKPQFNTVNDILSYGEGTYSQMNYAAQALLLSPHIAPSVIHLLELLTPLQNKVSDIAAHIGQATAVGSMILGLDYYASTLNKITVPVDLMTKYDLSQETLLRLSQGHLKDEEAVKDTREKLKNVVYETAVTANDHLLSARQKLAGVKEEIKEVVASKPNDELLQKNQKNWRKGVPDVIFTPLMVSTPTTLYLEKLEKYDFDVFNKKLRAKEWRLAWRSFRSYYKRSI